MKDLWDELYGSFEHRRFGDDCTPEAWERDEKGPDKHGYRYFLWYGCDCGVCAAGCRRMQEKQRAKLRQLPEDALTHEEWQAGRAA